MRKVIVTGCGRTGTQYTCAALEKLGFSCNHEKTFNASIDPLHPDLQLIGERLQAFDFHVSWLAAPFLKHLPLDTIVWHQVRDPLKSLRCWVQHKMLDCENETCKFVHKILPECAQGSDLARGVAYHREWNALCEYHHNLRYRQYRIECLTSELLCFLLKDAGYSATRDSVQWALDSVPKSKGTCGDGFHKEITWEQVAGEGRGAALYAMARRYGYDYE